MGRVLLGVELGMRHVRLCATRRTWFARLRPGSQPSPSPFFIHEEAYDGHYGAAFEIIRRICKEKRWQKPLLQIALSDQQVFFKLLTIPRPPPSHPDGRRTEKDWSEALRQAVLDALPPPHHPDCFAWDATWLSDGGGEVRSTVAARRSTIEGKTGKSRHKEIEVADGDGETTKTQSNQNTEHETESRRASNSLPRAGGVERRALLACAEILPVSELMHLARKQRVGVVSGVTPAGIESLNAWLCAEAMRSANDGGGETAKSPRLQDTEARNSMVVHLGARCASYFVISDGGLKMARNVPSGYEDGVERIVGATQETMRQAKMSFQGEIAELWFGGHGVEEAEFQQSVAKGVRLPVHALRFKAGETVRTTSVRRGAERDTRGHVCSPIGKRRAACPATAGSSAKPSSDGSAFGAGFQAAWGALLQALDFAPLALDLTPPLWRAWFRWFHARNAAVALFLTLGAGLLFQGGWNRAKLQELAKLSETDRMVFEETQKTTAELNQIEKDTEEVRTLNIPCQKNRMANRRYLQVLNEIAKSLPSDGVEIYEMVLEKGANRAETPAHRRGGRGTVPSADPSLATTNSSPVATAWLSVSGQAKDLSVAQGMTQAIQGVSPQAEMVEMAPVASGGAAQKFRFRMPL